MKFRKKHLVMIVYQDGFHKGWQTRTVWLELASAEA